MKKKVEGSANISEIETDGLKEHRAGSEKGVQRHHEGSNTDYLVSRGKDPYKGTTGTLEDKECWPDIENTVTGRKEAEQFRKEE